MTEKESPIINKTYDLMTWLVPVLTSFPKEHRFRMAERIETCLFTFHEDLLKAKNSKDRKPILLEADLELEKLRVYLRLAKDCHCLDFKKYEYGERLIIEVGKLLGGWLKAIKAKPVGLSAAVSGDGLEAAGRLVEQ